MAPFRYCRGQKVALGFTESPPELRLAKDKMGKGAIPFMLPILFLTPFSHSMQPQYFLIGIL